MAAGIGIGCYQFYLAKNVGVLEQQNRITAEQAARIRKKPMKFIGWLAIIAGLIMGILEIMGV